jgi:hypothetical protein
MHCNSLLTGLAACAIKPLQLIQKSATHLVFNLPRFSHVNLLLRTCQWVPDEASIHYKTIVLTFWSSKRNCPSPTFRLCSNPTHQTRVLRSATNIVLMLSTFHPSIRFGVYSLGTKQNQRAETWRDLYLNLSNKKLSFCVPKRFTMVCYGVH